MINFGNVKNEYEAALSAITAGCDMDMESCNYKNNLALLIKDKKVPLSLIDDAVRRILRKKSELGLFDDPYKYCNPEREQKELNNPEHAKAARQIAAKNIVLLKNEKTNNISLSHILSSLRFSRHVESTRHFRKENDYPSGRTGG